MLILRKKQKLSTLSHDRVQDPQTVLRQHLCSPLRIAEIHQNREAAAALQHHRRLDDPCGNTVLLQNVRRPLRRVVSGEKQIIIVTAHRDSSPPGFIRDSLSCVCKGS